MWSFCIFRFIFNDGHRILIYVKCEKPPEMTQEEVTKRFVHLLQVPEPEDDFELNSDDSRC